MKLAANQRRAAYKTRDLNARRETKYGQLSLPFYVREREWADLLNAPNVDVVNFILLAVLQQVV